MINLSDVSFEQATLAALMSIDAAYDEVCDKLHTESFLAERHKAIFEAITALKKESGRVDAILVMEWLESRKKLAVAGGQQYLMDLLANSPASLFNVGLYVDRMNDLAIRRSSKEALIKAQDQLIHNPDRSATDVVSDVISQLTSATSFDSESDAVEMKDALAAQLEHMQWLAENPDGCFGAKTGFIELDNLIGGMAAGDLIIVGARPSMGKTTFAMNVVEHAASSTNDPWLVISLEMPTLQLTQRIVSFCGGIPLNNIKSGRLSEDELTRYGGALARLSTTPISFNDRGSQTLAEIRRQAVALKRKHGKVGGIMVDYIGLMGGIDPNNKVNTIAEISKGLKALAKELKCPIIALSQLNRSLESRPNKRPVMSDLRESGAIEQDADIIMFLYRDEVYHPDTQAKGIAEVIVAKQRNGAIGKVALGFEGQYSRFTNLMTGYDLGDE